MSSEIEEISVEKLEQLMHCKTNNNKIEKSDDLGSSNFCHYTSANAANLIFKSGYFYASNMINSNDLNEQKLVNGNGKSIYTICFCNSDTEKIPLWYLYAGMFGNGVRLRLTKSKMKNFINGIKCIYPVDNGKVQDKIPLYRDKDFTLKFGQICYKKRDGSCIIKIKGKRYKLSHRIEDISEKYFIKDYEWEYEKEFRLVFITKEHYEKIAVPITISDFSVMFAPEIDDCKKNYWIEQEGFKKWQIEQLKLSELKINMNLLPKNYKSFLKYIEKNMTEKDSLIKSEELCEIIFNAQQCRKQEKD